jgi:hypothetical protein
MLPPQGSQRSYGAQEEPRKRIIMGIRTRRSLVFAAVLGAALVAAALVVSSKVRDIEGRCSKFVLDLTS